MTRFELSASDVAVFHVSNLGGCTGAALLSVFAQGVDLYGAPSPSSSADPAGAVQLPAVAAVAAGRACLLHCPLSSRASAGTPCLDYLQVSRPAHRPPPGYSGQGQPGLTASNSPRPATARAQVQPSPRGAVAASSVPVVEELQLHSVLLRGATVSTDYGSLSFDWATALTVLLTAPPTTSAPGASAVPPAPAAVSEARWVVGVEDLALRHEPCAYPPAPPAASPAPSNGKASSSCVNGSSSSSSSRAAPPPSSQSSAPAGAKSVSPVAVAVLVEAIRFEATVRSSAPPASSHQPPLQPPEAAGGRSASVQQQHQQPPQTHHVWLYSLGLHLAAADKRGEGWGPGDVQDLRPACLQVGGGGGEEGLGGYSQQQ